MQRRPEVALRPNGWKICVMSFPCQSTSGSAFVENVLQVLEPLAEEIFVITGNQPQSSAFGPKIRLMNAKCAKMGQSKLVNAARYVITHLEFSYNLATIINRVDVVILLLGGAHLLLPIMITRFYRKKVILVLTGWATKEAVVGSRFSDKTGAAISSMFSCVERLSYGLSNKIMIYSSALSRQLALEKYGRKIFVSGYYCSIDFDLFKARKPPNQRDYLVGYIGRLSEEKGILNFLEAIPKVLKRRGDVQFMIGGDGRCRRRVEEIVSKNGLGEKVRYEGWIPHDDLPRHLNELRLLVTPSYVEIVPAVALEAMACATPVLASPVGDVRSIIKDCDTGFIMEDNSPECIAKNILRALESENLDKITRNARAVVRDKMRFETVRAKYAEILESLD